MSGPMSEPSSRDPAPAAPAAPAASIGLPAAQAGERDYSQRMTYTYLIGAYLAANAIEDVFLLVEGPDCAYMKSQYIQGNHDWLSTLTTVSGFHRIANTALHPAMMTDSREGPLVELMQRIAAHPATGALLLTSMPMAFITGADYERLCRNVHQETGCEVLHVPGLSLSGDWLDGYAETLTALARQMALPGGDGAAGRRLDPRKLAVVGYLYDRNEDDHTANVAELRRMCAALDLELVSIWLAGQRFSELAAAAEAGTILSLPYGRKAAKALARRTGAELVTMPLPFGLAATEAWLSELGERFGRQEAAARFIDREMAHIAPRIEWLIPFVFQGVNAGYVGDPHLLPGIEDILGLLGSRLCFGAITNKHTHLRELGERGRRDDLLVWPKHKSFLRFVSENVAAHNVRLLVSNNAGVNFPLPDTTVVEFGFPSIFHHALFERPFLGYRGFLAFVDTLANALRRKELERHGRHVGSWGAARS